MGTRFSQKAVLSVCVLLLVMSAVAGAEGSKGFVRGDSLVTPQSLKAMMDAGDPKLIVIAVVDPKSYVLGHIPGSLQIWRGDYEPEGAANPYPYEGMMLDREAFQAFARNLGVDDDSTVVLYDEKYDATRVWWGFFLYGKRDVKVLDGGYQGWKHAGFDTDLGGAAKPAAEGTFTASEPLAGWAVGVDQVRLAQSDPGWKLWDTRESDEWNGEKLKKGAFRKGRIPWATFQNWKEFKQPVEGEKEFTEFKDVAGIEAVIAKYGMKPDQDNVFYCQSGVRTTTAMFALYLMGWDPAHLHNYDGSWIEWSYHEDLPVVVETP